MSRNSVTGPGKIILKTGTPYIVLTYGDSRISTTSGQMYGLPIYTITCFRINETILNKQTISKQCAYLDFVQ